MLFSTSSLQTDCRSTMTWPDWIWWTERPSMGLIVAMSTHCVRLRAERYNDLTRRAVATRRGAANQRLHELLPSQTARIHIEPSRGLQRSNQRSITLRTYIGFHIALEISLTTCEDSEHLAIVKMTSLFVVEGPGVMDAKPTIASQTGQQ
jgi:hypothetical protein